MGPARYKDTAVSKHAPHPHEACTPVGGLAVCGRDCRQSACLAPRDMTSQVLALQLQTMGCEDRPVAREGYAAEGSATGGCDYAARVIVISSRGCTPECSFPGEGLKP